MAENKTKATDASVADYIDSRASEEEKADCRKLIAIFKRVVKEKPKMWGPSIVGYGSYRYTYASGQTEEMSIAEYAIRGQEFLVYVDVESAEQQALLAKVGKQGWASAACTSNASPISTRRFSSS